MPSLVNWSDILTSFDINTTPANLLHRALRILPPWSLGHRLPKDLLQLISPLFLLLVIIAEVQSHIRPGLTVGTKPAHWAHSQPTTSLPRPLPLHQPSSLFLLGHKVKDAIIRIRVRTITHTNTKKARMGHDGDDLLGSLPEPGSTLDASLRHRFTGEGVSACLGRIDRVDG